MVTADYPPTPQKTVFVLPSLASGGAERVLITLMNGTNRDRYAPVLLTVNDKGELHHLIENTIPVHSLNQKSVLRSLPQLYAGLRKLDPDIVISTMAHMNFAVLSLKPFFPETRFIVREAITPSFLFDKYKPWDFLIRTLYAGYYPKADVILSPSQKILEELKNILPADTDKYMLLRNPVDSAGIRKKRPFPPLEVKEKNTVRFVACGRLVMQKGFDRLIAALPAMATEQNWHLTILGEGPERKSLERLIAKHSLSGKITLPGLTGDPYIHFGAADCFLLPSRFEGLPNVALESLACGTPVIALEEAGGIREIVQETALGTITIAKDMKDFLRAMENIKPSRTTNFRPSLLPGTFEKDNILCAFNTILDQSCGIQTHYTQDRRLASSS